MGPEKPPAPTISPETLRLQKQAEDDRITAIQDRLSRETRDTLIRFGRSSALGGGASASAIGKLGSFGGNL